MKTSEALLQIFKNNEGRIPVGQLQVWVGKLREAKYVTTYYENEGDFGYELTDKGRQAVGLGVSKNESEEAAPGNTPGDHRKTD